MTRLLALLTFSFGSTAALAGPVPPEFAGPQSPTKPAPFPITYIDQGKNDPRLAGILTPAGFKVEIVADVPTVINPVGMTFAPDGTMFVIEWAPDPYSDGRWFEFKETVHYRDGSTRQVATMKKFAFDPVKQLTFNPKTGKYDEAKVILMDELPSTLMWHDGWLYTASRGTVRRFRQSRPGGPWDIREVIAQGFCGFHHHQVSGLTIGNDGLLYITSGDDDNVVEGSDGSRATVMRTGAIFRCRPDGSHMEAYSLGYRNPYRDLAFDDQFNWFHADNDNEDGSKFTGCRLMHVTEGIDYGWRLAIGARCCRPDNLRGAVAGELPGKLPPMLKTGRGSPAGLLIYHDTYLPKRYQGLHYYPDVFRKSVRAYTVAPRESSFAITNEFEFMKSDDPLFRPCQMVTGPDGAMYVVDWRTNSGGAGKLWGDNTHGRIYRVTWSGTPDEPAIAPRARDSWAKLLAAGDDDLIKALAAPDFSDRLVARTELSRRGPAVAEKVRSALSQETIRDPGRLPALGVLQRHWSPAMAETCRGLLNDASPAVRRSALDALATHEKLHAATNREQLLKMLRDPAPAVRRSAVFAVARLLGDAESLLGSWKGEESKDPFLIDAYLRGVELCGKAGMQALQTLATSGNAADLDRAVTAWTTMRTRPFLDGLRAFLNNPHLSEGQRIAIYRSYSNYQFETPVSLDGLAEYFTTLKNPSATEVTVALETLAAGESMSSPVAVKFVTGLLSSDVAEIRSAALVAIESGRVTAARERVLAMAIDAKRATPERLVAFRALRAIGDTACTQPLLAVASGKENGTLRAEALRTASQFDGKASAEAARALLESAEGSLLNECVTVLGSTADGAKLIGERFLADKLPKDLLPRVSQAVRNHADKNADMAALSERIMKGGLLKAISGPDVERIKTQVMSRGNAARGKDLYLNSKALACVTCHRLEGVGGQIGPDLTRLWDTFTIEKLIESMLEPSKEIKEGYQSYRATTAGGQTHTGLKISDTATDVVIRESTGRDVRIPKSNLEELAASKVSLMPDNVVAHLNYDQFLDLLAFLKNKREQESLRGAVLEWSVSAGHPLDLKSTAQFESSADPATTGTWVPATGGSNGLSLREFGEAGIYASFAVQSNARQQVSLVLTSDDPVRVWAGGKLIFERTKPVAGGYGGSESIPLALNEGWTNVLIKVLPVGPKKTLQMKVSGEGVRTAAREEK